MLRQEAVDVVIECITNNTPKQSLSRGTKKNIAEDVVHFLEESGVAFDDDDNDDDCEDDVEDLTELIRG